LKVPFIDLRAQLESVRGPVEAAIRRVVDSQRFILGPEVEAFERRVAGLVGTRHAVGCASGTDAILLTLMGLGIGAGDEVAVPDFSFYATAGAVVLAGARPVFVDIEARTFNLDPARLPEAASASLRALIVVHLFGRTADMDRIRPWCEERGVILIEDAAQALGARFAGRAAGSLGRAGCFSFFPTKNLGAFGDAGLVTTDDAELAAALRALREHGRTGEYEHTRIGTNSRLDALQAAILGAKIDLLEEWNGRRRAHARLYAKLFAERGLGEPGSGLVLPSRDREEESTFHQYVVRVETGRDSLRRFLAARGIGCAVYYPHPLHGQPALAGHGRAAGFLREAERACREVLALPIYPELAPEQQEAVAEAVAAGIRDPGARGL
jgi:dTDP-4-amino-4,6-dideoxygalactose transaminase